MPLLVTEDERTLVTCINCLTKVKSVEFYINYIKNIAAFQYPSVPFVFL